MNKQDKSINLDKNYLLLLPRTHRISVRDEVGLREGEDGYGSLLGAENLPEGWSLCGVESPSSSPSDESGTQACSYIEEGRRENAQKKQERGRGKFAQILWECFFA